MATDRDHDSATFSQWNSIYANVWDVVPHAWDKLSCLVTLPPHPDLDDYPAFFAADSPLAPLPLKIGAGPMIYGAVSDAMTRSGYGSGGTTPFYVPCLTHITFTGSWGHL